MADDLSLLFKLRGDSTSLKAASAEGRVAINQLKRSFGSELGQLQRVATVATGNISTSFTRLASSLPVIGPTVSGLTSNLNALGVAGASTGQAVSTMIRPSALAAIGFVALGSAVASLSVKLFAVIEASSKLGSQIFDLSQKTGLGAERLSALKFAADESGSSIERFSNGLKLFALSISDANKGSEEAINKLKRLGIEPKQGIFDLEASLSKALQTIAKAPPGIVQMTLAADAFGKKIGPDLIPTIASFDGNLNALTDRVKSLGATMSDAEAKELDDFGDALDTIRIQASLLAARFSAQVAPEITRALQRISQRAGENQSAIEAWGKATSEALRGLRVVAESEVGRLLGLFGTLVVKTNLLVLAFKGLQLLGVASDAPNPDADFFGPGGAARGGRKSLPGTPEFREANKRRSEIEDFRNRLEASGGGTGGGVGGADRTSSKLKAALENQFDLIRDSIQDRAKQFQAETEDLHRELSKRQVDFQAYIDFSVQANNKKLLETLADLEIEREAIGRALARKVIDANDAAKKIRQIDDTERDARREAVKEQQRLDDLIDANKRKQFEATAEVVRATIDAQLRIAEIADEQRLTSIRALALARVQSEEDAEREILRIRLAAIDRESQRLKTEVAATVSITDPEEQLKAKARLNLQLRVLTAERTAIEQDGERDIDEGRRQDIENARRYADDLEEVQQRIVDIERDTAEEVLRLMVIHFASRRDVIRQRLQIDIDDENARHRNAQQGIAALKQENAESNRTKAEGLAQEQEINRLQEAEAERHRLALQGIRNQGRKDEAAASPLGQFQLGKDQLKEFALELESAIVPLNQILSNSFSQVADAIGSVGEQWVLLGTTGPAVMRKILAQALASIAAEAAVNAIKELALGFATLFFNPAESAAHFTAAGLWASIGAVSAVAGRAVAGDLFKPTTGGGAQGTRGGDRGELNPLDLARNSGTGGQPQIASQVQPQRVEVRVTVAEGKFADAIKTTVVDDFNHAGPIREVITNDGNLNRG